MKTIIPELVTTDDLASIIGVDARTIRNLVARGIVARTGRGKHELGPSIRSIIADAKHSSVPKPETDARAALVRAKAEEIKIRTAEKRRELIRFDIVVNDLSEIAGLFVASIEGLAARVTRDLTLRRKIDDEVFNIRTELSKKCAQKAKELGHERNDSEDGED